MRAAVMRNGEVVVDEVPEPSPGPGQVLVRTLACGICGSDLHAVRHGADMVAMSEATRRSAPTGMPTMHLMDIGHDVVLGHEFCAEVLDVGPNVGNCSPGDVVVSLPVAFDPEGLHAIGYSNRYPGGYGERMVLSDVMTMAVPDGVAPELAALTEPLAVGVHAVARADLRPGDSAVVVGCGPVGLAVIAALRLAGTEAIVAADFSSTRRDLARHLGATIVVDPRELPAVEAWRESVGGGRVVLFEAVGVPGVLDELMADAPARSRIVVVGVCMQPDTIRPMIGVAKELELRFVLAYEPTEFRAALDAIATGSVDLAPLVTGRVDLADVPTAFADLADPEAHAKILVVPGG